MKKYLLIVGIVVSLGITAYVNFLVKGDTVNHLIQITNGVHSSAV